MPLEPTDQITQTRQFPQKEETNRDHLSEISQQKANALSQLHITTSAFSGPIPLPDLLTQYAMIDHSLVTKIVEMAGAQARHRQDLEAKELDAQIKDMNMKNAEVCRGQYCAFSLSLASLVAGFCLAMFGDYEITGSIFGVSGIAGIVTSFIYGSKKPNHLQ